MDGIADAEDCAPFDSAAWRAPPSSRPILYDGDEDGVRSETSPYSLDDLGIYLHWDITRHS